MPTHPAERRAPPAYGLGLCLALAAWLPAAGWAQPAGEQRPYDDLLSIYSKALQADPQRKARRHQLLAEAAGGRLAKADSLPSLGASFTRTDTSISFDAPRPVSQERNAATFDEASFTEDSLGLNFKVPLLDLPAWKNWAAGSATIAATKNDWRSAEQEFMLRLTEAYLRTLAANDLVTAAKAREGALEKQHELVSQRLEVGLATTNDLEEAAAGRDSAQAGAISAETERESARLALVALVGSAFKPLAVLSEDYPLQAAERDLDEMLDNAKTFNPGLKAAEDRAKAAGLQSSAASLARLPKINLEAGYQDAESSVPPSFSQGTFGLDGGTLRIQATLSVPLYAGGAIRSRELQASNRRLAAEYQLEATRIQVSTSVRILTRQVEGAAVEARARRQAMRSSELALQAAQVGYEVGTRNVIDLVRAAQNYYDALYQYHSSRYKLVNARLRLRSAQGLLDMDDLRDLNKWLVAPGAS